MHTATHGHRRGAEETHGGKVVREKREVEWVVSGSGAGTARTLGTYFLAAGDLHLQLAGHVLGLLLVLLHLLLGLPHLLLEDIEKVATLDLCHDGWTDCAGSAHSTD